MCENIKFWCKSGGLYGRCGLHEYHSYNRFRNSLENLFQTTVVASKLLQCSLSKSMIERILVKFETSDC